MCQMPRIAAPRAFSLTSVSLSVLASRARMRRAVTLSCVLARGMILVGFFLRFWTVQDLQAPGRRSLLVPEHRRRAPAVSRPPVRPGLPLTMCAVSRDRVHRQGRQAQRAWAAARMPALRQSRQTPAGGIMRALSWPMMNAMTLLPAAAKWFETSRVDEATTLITEPHVIALMRCNIWHVRGRDHDLLVDTGMGLASVAGELAWPDRQACHRRRHPRAR